MDTITFHQKMERTLINCVKLIFYFLKEVEKMYRMINCSVEDQLRSTFESAYWAIHNNDACLVYRDKEKGEMYAIKKDGDSIGLFERYTGSLGMVPIAHGYKDVASCVEEIQPNIAKWQVY